MLEYIHNNPFLVVGLIAVASLVGIIISAVKLTISDIFETKIKFKKIIVGMLITASLTTLIGMLSIFLDLVHIDTPIPSMISLYFIQLTSIVLSLVFVCSKSGKLKPNVFVPLLMGINIVYFSVARYTVFESYISASMPTIAIFEFIAVLFMLIKPNAKIPIIIIEGWIALALIVLTSVVCGVYLGDLQDSVWDCALLFLHILSIFTVPALLCGTRCLISFNIPVYMNIFAEYRGVSNIDSLPPEQALRKLEALHAQGKISYKEYVAMRTELINSI